MVCYILYDFPKRIYIEKTDRQSCCIWCQRQYVKILFRIHLRIFQIDFRIFFQTVKNVLQFFLVILRGSKHIGKASLVLFSAAFRPVHYHGISHGKSVVSLGQQIIQCSGIGKFRIFSHRCIVTLFLSVRLK